MKNLFALKGKKILVTGASSGIGRQIAISCSELGAKIIITARNKERLEATYTLLKGCGHQMIIADLSEIQSRTKILNEIEILDGLVQNAGYNELIPSSFYDEENFKKITDINYKLPVLFTSELLKGKKIARGASIVFISSISAYRPAIGYGLYAGAKSALIGAAKTFAIELGKKNITVNLISPGMIVTDFVKNIHTEEELINHLKSYPLTRLGEPVDVANACIFLLSDAARWITGINLVVDGGITAK